MPILKTPHFRRRVLLVESDPELSEFLATALDLAGIDIHCASSAAQAAVLTELVRPAIIVTNSALVDTSAWLMIEKLRPRSGNTRIWFYAATPGPRDAEWATFAQVHDFFYYGAARWALFSAIVERIVFSAPTSH